MDTIINAGCGCCFFKGRTFYADPCCEEHGDAAQDEEDEEDE